MKLKEWAITNQPDKDLIYGEAYWEQIMFIRDSIGNIFAFSYKEYEEFRDTILVIGEHMSKSVKLPVYQFTWKDVIVTLRNNFYDWKVSVEAIFPLEIPSIRLFKDYVQNPLHCEGFPKEFVYGAYSLNHSKFTIELNHKACVLYTFLYLLMLSVTKENSRT